MTTAAVREVLLEIVIEAPRERVWRALVDQTTDWWHKDFYTRPAEGFFLQPKLGGWMYEDWGGPHRGIMDWTLTPVEGRPDATTLRFRHGLFGNISDKTRESLDGGWRMLFGECLKPFAESEG